MSLRTSCELSRNTHVVYGITAKNMCCRVSSAPRNLLWITSRLISKLDRVCTIATQRNTKHLKFTFIAAPQCSSWYRGSNLRTATQMQWSMNVSLFYTCMECLPEKNCWRRKKELCIVCCICSQDVGFPVYSRIRAFPIRKWERNVSNEGKVREIY